MFIQNNIQNSQSNVIENFQPILLPHKIGAGQTSEEKAANPVKLASKSKKTDTQQDYVSPFQLIVSIKKKTRRFTPNPVDVFKNEVDGTVLQLNGDSIECEVYTREQNRIIHLPKGLFDFEPKIGQPFSLSLDNSTGYRRPLIKLRALNKGMMTEGNDEMAALVNDL